MDVVFNKKQLFFLLRDFHRMTGLRVGIYSGTFAEVAAYPVRHSGFCKVVRANPEGLERCRQCDSGAFSRAREKQGAHVYRCHAGLTEAAAPIVRRGETLGYLMFGQMRDESGGTEQWDELRGSLTTLGFDVSYLESAFYRLPAVREELALTYARVLQACAVSVWLDEWIRMQSERLPERLDRCVSERLADPITIAGLSAELGVGKTTLCACAREYFGVTLGELVRRRRVERAQALLEQTHDPVASIAEQVGFPDYNYFTKVFRSVSGVTPTAWRKRRG